MFKSLRKKRDIRRKRAIRDTTAARFSPVRLGVVVACLLIMAAELLYLGGIKIFKFSFGASDSGRQSSTAQPVDNRLALTALNGTGREGADKSTRILDDAPPIMPQIWEEVQIVSEIKVIEPDEIVSPKTRMKR